MINKGVLRAFLFQFHLLPKCPFQSVGGSQFIGIQGRTPTHKQAASGLFANRFPVSRERRTTRSHVSAADNRATSDHRYHVPIIVGHTVVVLLT